MFIVFSLIRLIACHFHNTEVENTMQYYIWHYILIVKQCSGSERFLWEALILWKWQGTIAGLSNTQKNRWKVSPKIPKPLYTRTYLFWIVYWLVIYSLSDCWQCVSFLYS